jgi:hypothetical protein
VACGLGASGIACCWLGVFGRAWGAGLGWASMLPLKGPKGLKITNATAPASKFFTVFSLELQQLYTKYST